MTVPALPGEWDDLIVICAANNWDGVKLADQHMAERLARLAPVLYVDPPMSRLTPRRDPTAAASLNGPRLRLIDPGLARLTPVVLPFPMRRGMAKVTEGLVRGAILSAVRSLGSARIRALLHTWPLLDMFGCAGEDLRVYWAQDDFAAGAHLMNFDPARVRRGEAIRAAEADLVVAANPLVAERWRKLGYDVELVPYGADPETFAATDTEEPALVGDLREPVAAVIGHLNARLDITLLQATAEIGVSLLLVGPRGRSPDTELDALLARPNVTWVGPQPFEALPAFLRHASVGLVPYRDTDFNRASFPLKTLEYLAAGLPVVATGLPATRWLDTDLITIADAPDAFARAVQQAAGTHRDLVLMARRRAFAEQHSYQQRALDLLAAIDRRVVRDEPVPIRQQKVPPQPPSRGAAPVMPPDHQPEVGGPPLGEGDANRQ